MSNAAAFRRKCRTVKEVAERAALGKLAINKPRRNLIRNLLLLDADAAIARGRRMWPDRILECKHVEARTRRD
jgi:hypothetical protein